MLKEFLFPFPVVKVDDDGLGARVIRPVVAVKQQEEGSGMVWVTERKVKAVTNNPLALFLQVVTRSAIEVRSLHEAPGPHVVAGALQEVLQPPLQDTEGCVFHSAPKVRLLRRRKISRSVGGTGNPHPLEIREELRFVEELLDDGLRMSLVVPIDGCLQVRPVEFILKGNDSSHFANQHHLMQHPLHARIL